MKKYANQQNAAAGRENAISETDTAHQTAPVAAPAKKPVHHRNTVILLLMLAAGCTYLYCTLPQSGSVPPKSRRDSPQQLPLDEQYSKYMKEIEAVKNVTSQDSLKRQNDSTKLKK